MLEESSQMLPELNSIVDLHGSGGLIERLDVSKALCAVSISTQPGRHIARVQQDEICNNRSYCVVHDRKSELYNCIASLLSGLFNRIFRVTYVVFLAQGIKYSMRICIR